MDEETVSWRETACGACPWRCQRLVTTLLVLDRILPATLCLTSGRILHPLFLFSRYIGDTHPALLLGRSHPVFCVQLPLHCSLNWGCITRGPLPQEGGSAPVGGLSASGRVCSEVLEVSWVALCSLVLHPPPTAAMELKCTHGVWSRVWKETEGGPVHQGVTPVHS